MNQAQTVKNARKVATDTFETLNQQLTGPILEEARRELGGFGGIVQSRYNTKEIATEELKRAREEQNLQEKNEQDSQTSHQKTREVIYAIKEEYRQSEFLQNQKQQKLNTEVIELKEEIVQLAKTAGIETKIHIQPNTKKVGILDIKLLGWIIRLLRVKTKESKSAQDLAAQRSNSKRTTGMLAWVSGKQMKVHEQGTLHLQG